MSRGLSNRGGGGILLSSGERCAGGCSPEHVRDAALLARAQHTLAGRVGAARAAGRLPRESLTRLRMVTGLIQGFVDRPWAELSPASRRLCCMVLNLAELPPVVALAEPAEDVRTDPTSAHYLPKLPPGRRA